MEVNAQKKKVHAPTPNYLESLASITLMSCSECRIAPIWRYCQLLENVAFVILKCSVFSAHHLMHEVLSWVPT